MLAITNDISSTKQLLRKIKHLLPNRFYAHLSSGLQEVLQEKYQLSAHGEHFKMALKNKSKFRNLEKFYKEETRCLNLFKVKTDVIQLTEKDIADILELYKISYPGNWFDERMLATGKYFGIRKQNRLISVTGIHVYSQKYNVAALGNICTHPDFRGKGFGRAATAKLCKSLLQEIEYIGLNVKADNKRAISLYEKLGFEIVSSYLEFMVKFKENSE